MMKNEKVCIGLSMFSPKEKRLLQYSTDTINNRKTDSASENTEENEQAREKIENLKRTKFAEFIRIISIDTGAAGHEDVEGYMNWVRNMEYTKKNADQFEEYLELEDESDHAIMLYNDLQDRIAEATQKSLISASSGRRWIERFRDPNIGYKAKEYWVQHQLPDFIRNWEKAAKERKELLKDPRFRDVDPKFFDLTKITDEKKFLELHYEDRAGILAKARAAILAAESGKADLYTKAKTLLNKAATKKVMSSSKIGVWLERIFKSKTPRAQIEKFLKPGSKSLQELIDNWTDVKKRYDFIAEKLSQQKGNVKSRGLNLVSEVVFLNMHYDQRLKYMQETEYRLHDSKDANSERPEFLNIRHALDMKDWEDAEEEIKNTEKLRDLSEGDRKRLQSMKQSLAAFRDDTTKGKEGKKSPQQEVEEANQTISRVMKTMPSNIQPLADRLLRSPTANRNMHQLRWIVYNNKWCRDHNYLDQRKMRIGASRESKEQTKWRGDHEIDIGLHDHIDESTAANPYFRKEKFSKRKPTIFNLNAKSAAAQHALARRLEVERDPRELYWTTLSIHEDGMPMSNQYHDDLLRSMTELRQATKILEKHGLMYGGKNMQPVPFSRGEHPVIQN